MRDARQPWIAQGRGCESLDRCDRLPDIVTDLPETLKTLVHTLGWGRAGRSGCVNAPLIRATVFRDSRNGSREASTFEMVHRSPLL